MVVNSSAKTHDCPPTLTDRQVLDFCKNGYLMLEAVVPARASIEISGTGKSSSPGATS